MMETVFNALLFTLLVCPQTNLPQPMFPASFTVSALCARQHSTESPCWESTLHGVAADSHSEQHQTISSQPNLTPVKVRGLDHFTLETSYQWFVDLVEVILNLSTGTNHREPTNPWYCKYHVPTSGLPQSIKYIYIQYCGVSIILSLIQIFTDMMTTFDILSMIMTQRQKEYLWQKHRWMSQKIFGRKIPGNAKLLHTSDMFLLSDFGHDIACVLVAFWLFAFSHLHLSLTSGVQRGAHRWTCSCLKKSAPSKARENFADSASQGPKPIWYYSDRKHKERELPARTLACQKISHHEIISMPDISNSQWALCHNAIPRLTACTLVHG